MPVSYLQHRQACGVFHNGRSAVYLKPVTVVSMKNGQKHPERNDCGRFRSVVKVATSTGSRFLMNISLLYVWLVLLVEVDLAVGNLTCDAGNDASTTRQASAIQMSVPELNRFLRCRGFQHSFVLLMLLVIAGDVEQNPGPVKKCYGWDYDCKKEIHTTETSADELRQYVYVDDNNGRRTIMMRNWKQLPTALTELSELQDLVIHNDRNMPLEVIPQEISRLKGLIKLEVRCLGLSPKLFQSTWMQTIQQLVSLEELDIQHYDLSQCVAGICSLTNLQQLTMYQTNLSSLPVGISWLTTLKTLNVRVNKLTSLPEGISGLTNLETLDVSCNELASLPEGISGLTNLETLDVSYNKLTSLPEGISWVTTLKTLNVRVNKLTSLPEGIRGLTNLKRLHVSDNELASLPEGISGLTNLETLDVRDNKLTSLPEGIILLTNLWKLKLEGNPVTDMLDKPGALQELPSATLEYVKERRTRGMLDYPSGTLEHPSISTARMTQAGAVFYRKDDALFKPWTTRLIGPNGGEISHGIITIKIEQGSIMSKIGLTLTTEILDRIKAKKYDQYLKPAPVTIGLKPHVEFVKPVTVEMKLDDSLKFPGTWFIICEDKNGDWTDISEECAPTETGDCLVYSCKHFCRHLPIKQKTEGWTALGNWIWYFCNWLGNKVFDCKFCYSCYRTYPDKHVLVSVDCHCPDITPNLHTCTSDEIYEIVKGMKMQCSLDHTKTKWSPVVINERSCRNNLQTIHVALVPCTKQYADILTITKIDPISQEQVNLCRVTIKEPGITEERETTGVKQAVNVDNKKTSGTDTLVEDEAHTDLLNLPTTFSQLSSTLSSSASLTAAASHRSRVHIPGDSEIPRMPHIYAVMIAGSDDKQSITRLFYRDVVYLKMVLTDKRIMAVRPEDLIVISAESTNPVQQLSATNVKAAIGEIKDKINTKVTEDLDKSEKEDLCFILYYSGHSKYGMLYLSDDESISGNDIQQIFDFMDTSRKLVILDCCYSDDTQCVTTDVDAQIPDCTERQMGFGSKSPSQILQWSSSGMSQKSYYDVNKLSIFTDYIIRGLCSAQISCMEGAAPECKSCTTFIRGCQTQGCVKLFPLMEYVHDHVQQCVSKKFWEQHINSSSRIKENQQHTSTKGKFSKDLPFAHYNTERLCYFIDVKVKDQTYSVMLCELPEDVEQLKRDIMEQVISMYLSEMAADALLKIRYEGKELNNMEEIKQIFELTETIYADVLLV